MKLVLLPGLDGSSTLRCDFVAALAPDLRPVVLSYPATMTRYEELEQWIRERLPQEDHIIVAESFSGPLGIRLAADPPPFLHGMVLVSTFARSPRCLPSAIAEILRLGPLGSPLLFRMIQPLLMGRWAEKEFADRLANVVRSLPSRTIVGRLREVLRVNVLPELHRADIPMIFLKASRDRLVAARTAEDFYRAGIAIVEVEGPHFLLQACPHEGAQRVEAFLSTLT